jgi:hypothetical protein
MAISTLNKFTVPLASDQSSSTQGMLMPKLKYRFRVTLENFGVGNGQTELTKMVVDFTRPTVNFEEIALPTYNSTVKMAGRQTWADATLNLRDDATGNVTKLVGSQLQKQFDFFEMASAASAIDYKFLTRVEMLDGGNGQYAPTVLETWELYGCYLKSVNYNNVAYSANEAATMALTITFDNAQQTPQGTGVGTAVGRTLGTLATGAGK